MATVDPAAYRRAYGSSPSAWSIV